jgi:hypothetical protein
MLTFVPISISRLALGPTQLSIQWVSGTLPVVKLPGCEAELEMKNILMTLI